MGNMGFTGSLIASSSWDRFFCSLSVNDLDADAGKAIADALKANKTIQSVK